MKKILISALALALPALASAQTQLISGYNFGQFLGSGPAALDATTFADATSIGSNFRLNVQAPSSSSGNNDIDAGDTGDYSNGFGRLNYNFASATVLETGANSINGMTVQGYSLALQGDEIGLALTLSNSTFTFVQNTSGYADFVQGAGNLKNLSFAAASGSGATITWSIGGSSVGSTSVAAGGAFGIYSLDLPDAFYGQNSVTLTGVVTGSASLDNVQFNGVTAIPEPGTYAAILGALTLGVVAIRRRKAAVAA
jgi:hypothetical protein